jgi:hypothetical protein
MQNEITPSKGGRPSAEITNGRIIEVMRLIYRGRGSLGAIMDKLSVSQTSASNLRKKAFKALRIARGEDEEIKNGKYMATCQIECLIIEAWKVVDRINSLYLWSVNAKDEVAKLKYLEFILSCYRFSAELNGNVQANPRNQMNFLTVGIMNALNLTINDFNRENINATLLKLNNLYQNSSSGKDATDACNQINNANPTSTLK